jgi:uncharacterized membrane protein YhaH (DUF805 family)
MNWYLAVIKKYATFSGRARRKEYWMFVLFNVIFVTVAIVLDNVLGIAIKNTGYGPIYFLYVLAVFLPGLAVSVRRLHDVGWSGWYLFLSLIPLVGPIILLVKTCTDGTPGVNQYGANPKGGPMVVPQSQLTPVITGQNPYSQRAPSTGTRCQTCGGINAIGTIICQYCNSNISQANIQSNVQPLIIACPSCNSAISYGTSPCPQCRNLINY